jgi:hypothetical protein
MAMHLKLLTDSPRLKSVVWQNASTARFKCQRARRMAPLLDVLKFFGAPIYLRTPLQLRGKKNIDWQDDSEL